MFWFFKKLFKQKIWFDFGGSARQSLTYPTPKKALCPANITDVARYASIQYNISQRAAMTTTKQSNESPAHAHEPQDELDCGHREALSEQPPTLPLVQHDSKARSYMLKVQPVRFTKQTRKILTDFARQHPRLRDDFLEEAKRTLAINTGQVAEALKRDLSTHIDNMRTVYEIFGTLKELDRDIRAKNEEAAELILKGASPDAVASVNDEIAELQRARNGLTSNYVAPLRAQHAKGKQMVYHIRNRITESLDRLENLKSFYCTVSRTLGVLPLDEFKSDRKADEATLIKVAFEEKEVISAMKKYGAVLGVDGTFEVSIIDLGGGEVDKG